MIDLIAGHFWACWWLVIIVVIGAGSIIDNMWTNYCNTRKPHDN